MTKKERLEEVIQYYSNGKPSVFARFLGVAPSTVSSWLARDTFDSELLFAKCENINPQWLLTGEGSMLKQSQPTTSNNPNTPTRDNYETTTRQLPAKKHLIPFYDDVNSFGGLGERVANVETPAQPAEWIDAGDWFHEATAAIRHYGSSMIEYPSGSILALKQVNDLRLIIPGRNYVVETTEFRVTKQLQPHTDHLMAYSTNRDTYPDGSLINAPFLIPLETVRTIWQVLGCVIKEYSGGAVYIHK